MRFRLKEHRSRVWLLQREAGFRKARRVQNVWAGLRIFMGPVLGCLIALKVFAVAPPSWTLPQHPGLQRGAFRPAPAHPEQRMAMFMLERKTQNSQTKPGRATRQPNNPANSNYRRFVIYVSRAAAHQSIQQTQ
jgi:hypothetical protein